MKVGDTVWMRSKAGLTKGTVRRMLAGQSRFDPDIEIEWEITCQGFQHLVTSTNFRRELLDDEQVAKLAITG